MVSIDPRRWKLGHAKASICVKLRLVSPRDCQSLLWLIASEDNCPQPSSSAVIAVPWPALAPANECGQLAIAEHDHVAGGVTAAR